MKVYLIEIGNTTRRGGFITQSIFAVQSESEQNGIYAHYQKRYAGFSVNVSEVTVLEENVVAIPNTFDGGETQIECKINYPKEETIAKAVEQFVESEKTYHEKRTVLTKLLNEKIRSITIEDYKTKYYSGSFEMKVKLSELINLRMEQGLK